MDNSRECYLRVSSRLKLFAFVFLLLVLVFGPGLQGRDCFNDCPNHDHDVTLHLVDALLCVAVSASLVGTILLLVAVTSEFLGFPPTPLLRQIWARLENHRLKRVEFHSPPLVLRV